MTTPTTAAQETLNELLMTLLAANEADTTAERATLVIEACRLVRRGKVAEGEWLPAWVGEFPEPLKLRLTREAGTSRLRFEVEGHPLPGLNPAPAPAAHQA